VSLKFFKLPSRAVNPLAYIQATDCIPVHPSFPHYLNDAISFICNKLPFISRIACSTTSISSLGAKYVHSSTGLGNRYYIHISRVMLPLSGKLAAARAAQDLSVGNAHHPGSGTCHLAQSN
jgi:hypothetical protein